MRTRELIGADVEALATLLFDTGAYYTRTGVASFYPAVTITFVIDDPRSVSVVGDFNDWDPFGDGKTYVGAPVVRHVGTFKQLSPLPLADLIDRIVRRSAEGAPRA